MMYVYILLCHLTGREGSSPGETGKGIALFKKRQEHVEYVSAKDVKKRAESVQKLNEVTRDPVLSPTEKALFAETLREVS